jgi:hypothetical protein
MPIVSTGVASQARAERVEPGLIRPGLIRPSLIRPSLIPKSDPMAHLLERLQRRFSPQILASAVLTARVTRNGYPAGQA